MRSLQLCATSTPETEFDYSAPRRSFVNCPPAARRSARARRAHRPRIQGGADDRLLHVAGVTIPAPPAVAQVIGCGLLALALWAVGA
jgi:hypothetical protein